MGSGAVLWLCRLDSRFVAEAPRLDLQYCLRAPIPVYRSLKCATHAAPIERSGWILLRPSLSSAALAATAVATAQLLPVMACQRMG